MPPSTNKLGSFECGSRVHHRRHPTIPCRSSLVTMVQETKLFKNFENYTPNKIKIWWQSQVASVSSTTSRAIDCDDAGENQSTDASPTCTTCQTKCMSWCCTTATLHATYYSGASHILLWSSPYDMLESSSRIIILSSAYSTVSFFTAE
jgi:hypothetical protein